MTDIDLDLGCWGSIAARTCWSSGRWRPAGRCGGCTWSAATRRWACTCAAWCRAARPRVRRAGPTAATIVATRAAPTRTAGRAPSGPAAPGAAGWSGARPRTGGSPPAARWSRRAARRCRFDLDDRDLVWADLAPRLYAQAAAAQWDPATAVDWDAPVALPDEIEAAVVQVMTYLVENEQAALVVPARFLGRIHPHFREVLQLLAVQAADEARHMEVFTRRAAAARRAAGRPGAAGGRR